MSNYLIEVTWLMENKQYRDVAVAAGGITILALIRGLGLAIGEPSAGTPDVVLIAGMANVALLISMLTCNQRKSIHILVSCAD